MHYQILAALRRRWKIGHDDGFIFESFEICDLSKTSFCTGEIPQRILVKRHDLMPDLFWQQGNAGDRDERHGGDEIDTLALAQANWRSQAGGSARLNLRGLVRSAVYLLVLVGQGILAKPCCQGASSGNSRWLTGS